ncbi:MAG: NAD(P)H-dependent oxidoreductase [Saprospiraceae bacterium]
MITVISGTNRPNSKTELIARQCCQLLKSIDENVRYIDLQNLNIDMIGPQMYLDDGQHPYIAQIQEEILIPSDQWLIVSPEYNGSFPGILKLFIDALSVRRSKETFSSKRAALIGVATGRAGNFRGMEHLTGILNYLNVIVMPNKLPISSIHHFLGSAGEPDVETNELLLQFVKEMVQFNENFREQALY